LEGTNEVVQLVGSTLRGVVEVQYLRYAEPVLEVKQLVGLYQITAIGFQLLASVVEASYLLIIVGGDEDLNWASGQRILVCLLVLERGKKLEVRCRHR